MMSETKFTKGEWELSLDMGGNTLIHCGGEAICGGINCNHQGDNVDPHNVEAEANAHLIAAAPDMYKEIERDFESLHCKLIDAVTAGDADSIKDDIKRKSRLLAKARGE